jgi:hypothetical protein
MMSNEEIDEIIDEILDQDANLEKLRDHIPSKRDPISEHLDNLLEDGWIDEDLNQKDYF